MCSLVLRALTVFHIISSLKLKEESLAVETHYGELGKVQLLLSGVVLKQRKC